MGELIEIMEKLRSPKHLQCHYACYYVREDDYDGDGGMMATVIMVAMMMILVMKAKMMLIMLCKSQVRRSILQLGWPNERSQIS